MTRAVIYARLSRDRTGEGLAVERQIDACMGLAKSRGWDVVGVERDDSISAYSGKLRPGWERVQTMMATGQVDVVMAWAMDRITRSISELEKLIRLSQDSGVAIATASGDLDLTTDQGRLVARLLGAVATAEVERKSARQKAANQQHAEMGRPWRGAHKRFGYTADLQIIPAEAAAIRKGAADYLAGVSYAQIARDWIALGLSSAQAGKEPWTFQGVKNVLRNPVYIGIRRFNGVDYKGEWEPILNMETHLAVTAKQATAQKRFGGGKHGRQPENLLTGIARCGVCDGTVFGNQSHGRPVYGCHPLPHISVRRDEADYHVLHELGAMLSFEGFKAELVASANGDDGDAKHEYDKLEKMLDEFAEDRTNEIITRSQFTKATEKIRRRMAELEEKVALSEDGALLAGLDIGDDQVLDELLDLPLARQRALVARFLDVTLFKVGGRRGVPIEDRVLIRRAKRD